MLATLHLTSRDSIFLFNRLDFSSSARTTSTARFARSIAWKCRLSSDSGSSARLARILVTGYSCLLSDGSSALSSIPPPFFTPSSDDREMPLQILYFTEFYGHWSGSFKCWNFNYQRRVSHLIAAFIFT